MASANLSEPIDRFSLPPLSSSLNQKISHSITDPSNPKPSYQKPENKIVLKIRLKHHPIGSSVVESEPTTTSKESTSCFPVNDQTNQPDDHNSIQPRKAAKKGEKKRRLSVTLPKAEIEEDIAAIEALAGVKRLRRPKKREQSLKVDQKKIDRLFPGLDYIDELGFY